MFICPPCHYTCKTCDGPLETDCLTCNTTASENRIYDSTNKKCLCEPKFYDDGLFNETCLACDYTCKNCLDNLPASCTECNTLGSEHRFYPIGTPLTGTCTCDDFYFENSPNETCLSCHYSCYSCTGLTIN